MRSLRTVPDSGVVLFHTSTAAMQSEAEAARAGLSVRLIPAPRELSSDCGVALLFEWSDREHLDGLLAAAGVEVAGVHEYSAAV